MVKVKTTCKTRSSRQNFKYEANRNQTAWVRPRMSKEAYEEILRMKREYPELKRRSRRLSSLCPGCRYPVGWTLARNSPAKLNSVIWMNLISSGSGCCWRARPSRCP